MLKKFYILSFIIVFLLATTGFPLSLHLCAMQSSAALTSCEMCASEPASAKTCCNENIDETNTYYSKAANSCCQTRIIDKKVKDEFFPKTELKNFSITSVIFVTLSENLLDVANDINFNSNSPPIPPGSGNIYLDISLLLI